MATDDQCSACGERNPADTAFCLFCDTYLGWDGSGRGPAPPTSSGGALPPPGKPAPLADGSSSGVPASAAESRGVPTPDRVDHALPVQTLPSSPGGTTCPRCSQPNGEDLRFCSRCGHQLASADTATSAPALIQTRRRWWDPESRAARREYRRSLPSTYRWRRVMVVLSSIACVALVLNVTGNSPVAFLQDRWRDATVELTPISGVSAAAKPQSSVAPTYAVEKLPGPREESWATTWPAGATAAEQCWGTPAEGAIVLRWDEPTRVRGLDVWAGLDADNSERARQFLPKRLGVRFGDLCVRLRLQSTPERQRLLFDTKTEVTSLRITVGDVYPNSATPAENLVAIGGLDVLHQPS